MTTSGKQPTGQGVDAAVAEAFGRGPGPLTAHQVAAENAVRAAVGREPLDLSRAETDAFMFGSSEDDPRPVAEASLFGQSFNQGGPVDLDLMGDTDRLQADLHAAMRRLHGSGVSESEAGVKLNLLIGKAIREGRPLSDVPGIVAAECARIDGLRR